MLSFTVRLLILLELLIFRLEMLVVSGCDFSY